MDQPSDKRVSAPSREQLLHKLYEAAELEHNLMCTYLYAAFSLRDRDDPSLSPREAEAVERFRATIIRVATEEMGHLAAVWNITSALGGAPCFARDNFPLDPGSLPASVVVRLAPFSDAVLQHFIYLERPHDSREPEGEGFAPEWPFQRSISRPRLTPMGTDYATVGEFYAELSTGLSAFVAKHGESAAFCGDPALQLTAAETRLVGIKPVICAKTALAAFDAIVRQGEGAAVDADQSHYRLFANMRSELTALRADNPRFQPSHPAAVNPVLRRPTRPEGRVWIEDEPAALLVDSANSAYMLMLRLLAYAYVVPRPQPEKSLALDLAVGLMRAATPLAEAAARRPAGPSNPSCNAGMTFTALRETGALPHGSGARRFFVERIEELSNAAAALSHQGERERTAAALLNALQARAQRGFQAAEKTNGAHTSALQTAAPANAPQTAPQPNGSQAAPQPGAFQAAPQPGAFQAAPQPGAFQGAPQPTALQTAPQPTALQTASQADGSQGVPRAVVAAPVTEVIDGVEHVQGRHLELQFEGKRCIHARFCVTYAPTVFLANVKGPWIHPDTIPVERLVEVAHACPSGAIRYRRKDGQTDETAPPVNLTSVRENGPYAVRADIRLDGQAIGYRATLCRCGASQNKPFCDGSHNAASFTASGEPSTGAVDMLPVRDGPLEIDPELNGPLVVRGNLEILSGTGRAIARTTNTRLCRCGGSANKPYCDNTHSRIGFRSN